MSKVITFSTRFPAYHPKAGQPTYFVEKILKGLVCLAKPEGDDPFEYAGEIPSFNLQVFKTCEPKYHTIRAGHRFKAGEYFSPRIWSGRPYNSPQITIAPDIKIEKVWNFVVKPTEKYARYFINNKECEGVDFMPLVRTDGFLWSGDFEDWFQYKPFDGQIICWNKDINY